MAQTGEERAVALTLLRFVCNRCADGVGDPGVETDEAILNWFMKRKRS